MSGRRRASRSHQDDGASKPADAPAPQDGDASASAENDALVSTAFGEKNRLRLIEEYFASATTPVDATMAWAHVYRMLLWTDRTTGLAHCYESDKTQPGKPWYARSLAFHSWLAGELGAAPANVGEQIDWMFQKAAAELAAEVLRKSAARTASAAKQRQPYEGKVFPAPGEDPELVAIVRSALGDLLISEPAMERWNLLVQRVRQYLALDNKRKNLLGEGFEDVLGAVVRRTCVSSTMDVRTRSLLHELPGFNRARRGEKPNKVDLAIIKPSMRTLVTAKWSVRADREKQFVVDYDDYIQAESDGKRFDYVFLTNEFDPARLMRACEKLQRNASMFTHVVHINTDALRATYGAGGEESMRKVLGYVDSGRLISLEKWLGNLAAP
jgi:hypothetical protein